MICEWCGEEFKAKQSRSRFCSKKCTCAFYYMQRKSRALPKKCPVCGKDFEASGKSPFCSDECRKAALKKRTAEREAEYKKYKAPKRKRTKPKLSIAQINERARAEGLNYGQYVGKYGL